MKSKALLLGEGAYLSQSPRSHTDGLQLQKPQSCRFWQLSHDSGKPQLGALLENINWLDSYRGSFGGFPPFIFLSPNFF